MGQWSRTGFGARVLSAGLFAGLAIAGVIAALAVVGGATQSTSSHAASRSAFNVEKQLASARDITRNFGHDLQLELSKALRSRGLVAAVGAYNAAAPEIAAKQSDRSGFEVRRIALKLRNPENEATDWERKILVSFLAKGQTGADPRDMERYEIISTRGGDKRFRYMKAIVVRNSCLDCHGPNIARDVKSEIAKYYHDDKSWGFKRGDIIGAYSLVMVIE